MSACRRTHARRLADFSYVIVTSPFVADVASDVVDRSIR